MRVPYGRPTTLCSVHQFSRQGFAASFIMGFAAYQFLNAFDKIFDINTFKGIFSQGLLAGLFGVAVGAVLYKLLGSREFDEVAEGLRHKFWKSKAIAPEQEVL